MSSISKPHIIECLCHCLWLTLLVKPHCLHQNLTASARFVRWSDGSLQLLIGEEVLDVSEVDTTSDHGYLYSRPKQATLLEVLYYFSLHKHALLYGCSLCLHFFARMSCAC